jgi:hypothetical protein
MGEKATAKKASSTKPQDEQPIVLIRGLNQHQVKDLLNQSKAVLDEIERTSTSPKKAPAGFAYFPGREPRPVPLSEYFKTSPLRKLLDAIELRS